MAKLLGVVLALVLLVFAAAPFGLPVTTVAFAGTYEDVRIAIGGANSKIFNEEQAERKKSGGNLRGRAEKYCRDSTFTRVEQKMPYGDVFVFYIHPISRIFLNIYIKSRIT